jgi:hypothetical protein
MLNRCACVPHSATRCASEMPQVAGAGGNGSMEKQ